MNARQALAERGDRSGKCLPDDERDIMVKQAVTRLFDPKRAKSEEEKTRTLRLRDATLKAAAERAATKAVEREVQRIATERKASLEERYGPQPNSHDLASAMNRLAESNEKQTAVLEALAKALTSGGKK